MKSATYLEQPPHLNHKQTILMVIALILIGLNLRPSMAAIGPLLPQIQASLALSYRDIAMLTSLPVICMGLAMLLSRQRIGAFSDFQWIICSLILIGVSHLLRLFAVDQPYLLFVTALSAGCGIAALQAIIPYMIKTLFRNQITMYMGLYVSAIMAGAALSAALAPWIEHRVQSWALSLAFWSLLSGLAVYVWIQLKSVCINLPSSQAQDSQHFSFYRIPRAWLLCLFFGLSTASYTCVLAWLVPYFIDLGWKNTDAGLLLALLSCVEVIAGLLFPFLSKSHNDRRWILALLLLACIFGYLGLILIPNSASILWIVLLGLGIGGLFPMSLILTLDHLDSAQAAGQLMCFVQGGGYLIAGCSPFFAGLLRDLTGSFNLAWMALLGISCLLMIVVPRFNAKHYKQNMTII